MGEGFGVGVMFNMIEPSPHDPATAYVTATRYKNDDYAPYVFKTTDYGESWTLITDGIAGDHFCRALRADPRREGLLYLGTEFGLYISFDGGESWERFQLNLPVSPIYDMQIKGTDLVVATHGRSFWILDDVTVLHQINPHPKSLPHKEGGTFFSPSLLVGEGAGGWGEAATLLKPRTVERHLPKVFEGLFESGEGKQYMSTLGMVAPYLKEETPEHGVKHRYLDSGANPPKGAVITYYLREEPKRRYRCASTTSRAMKSRLSRACTPMTKKRRRGLGLTIRPKNCASRQRPAGIASSGICAIPMPTRSPPTTTISRAISRDPTPRPAATA